MMLGNGMLGKEVYVVMHWGMHESSICWHIVTVLQHPAARSGNVWQKSQGRSSLEHVLY